MNTTRKTASNTKKHVARNRYDRKGNSMKNDGFYLRAYFLFINPCTRDILLNFNTSELYQSRKQMLITLSFLGAPKSYSSDRK